MKARILVSLLVVFSALFTQGAALANPEPQAAAEPDAQVSLLQGQFSAPASRIDLLDTYTTVQFDWTLTTNVRETYEKELNSMEIKFWTIPYVTQYMTYVLPSLKITNLSNEYITRYSYEDLSDRDSGTHTEYLHIWNHEDFTNSNPDWFSNLWYDIYHAIDPINPHYLEIVVHAPPPCLVWNWFGGCFLEGISYFHGMYKIYGNATENWGDTQSGMATIDMDGLWHGIAMLSDPGPRHTGGIVTKTSPTFSTTSADIELRMNGSLLEARSKNLAPIDSFYFQELNTSLQEGAEFIGSGSFYNNGTAVLSGTVDYGDGSEEQALVLNQVTNTFGLQHAYTHEGPYNVEVCMKVDSQTPYCQSVTVTVSNVTPGVLIIPNTNTEIVEGNIYEGSGQFSDPGTDTWSATVDYGDGSGVQPLDLDTGNKTFQLSHLFSDHGGYPVEVCVTDDYGATGCNSLFITVSNVAPVVNAGEDATINEGETFARSGSFTDPGSDTWTATVDYGEAGVPATELALTGKTFSLSHTFIREGVYPVTVCVTDGSEPRCDTVTVTVINVLPVVEAGAGGTIDEGSIFTSSGSFTDPGSDTWTATVDYGDGAGEAALPLSTDKTFSLSHQYTNNKTYTVTVCVSDGTGKSCDSAAVLVNNVLPVVEAGAGGTIDEGSTFTSSGSFTDPGSDTWTATVNYGEEGAPVEDLALTGKTFTLSHTFIREGVYPVTVCVTDGSEPRCDTVMVTVNNVLPMVEAGAGSTINEGGTFTGSGSFTDPGSDTWKATVDYGDGEGKVALPFTDKAFSLSHLYANNKTYTVTVCVSDGAGEICDTAVVIVNNVLPAVEAGDNKTINEGETFTSSGSFTDPGSDTWAATVDYGEKGGPIGLALTGKTFSLNHTYADNGTFTVSVCVTDDVGPGCDSAIVTVNNQAPSVVVTGDASQTVQYSDDIGKVTFTAKDVLADTITATASGLPDGLTLSDGICGVDEGKNTCTWELSGTVKAAEGKYDIKVTISDGEPGGSIEKTVALTVKPEDARIDYDITNPVSVQVAAAGGPTGAFSLKFQVAEKSPDAATYGAKPGDLTKALVSMSLVPVGPGGTIAGACTSTKTGSEYGQILSVTCTFNVVPVNTYSVVTEVKGGYYQAAYEDVLMVYDPSLGFTTGGGWFYWPQTGERTNFGYTMKYNKSGNIQGSLLLIRHLADGSIYRVKSNALYGLALGESKTDSMGWASFSGKATYLQPGWADPKGNFEFTVYVEDWNEPGSGTDKFWIQVNASDLMMAAPGSGHAVEIGGGNILVPHGAKR